LNDYCNYRDRSGAVITRPFAVIEQTGSEKMIKRNSISKSQLVNVLLRKHPAFIIRMASSQGIWALDSRNASYDNGAVGGENRSQEGSYSHVKSNSLSIFINHQSTSSIMQD